MRVEYFAWVRERLGKKNDDVSLPSDVTDIAGLIEFLATYGGTYSEIFSDPTGLRAAKNDALVPFDTPINDQDRVALFPPMTGG